MDRPPWSALTDMIGDLRRSASGLGEAQRRLMDVTGTAWSEDRLVKIVVGPRGQLVDVEIDPRVYRKPNSKALAASILTTARAAVEQATKRAQEIYDDVVPSDMRGVSFGGVDMRQLIRSHDADLHREV